MLSPVANAITVLISIFIFSVLYSYLEQWPLSKSLHRSVMVQTLTGSQESSKDHINLDMAFQALIAYGFFSNFISLLF